MDALKPFNTAELFGKLAEIYAEQGENTGFTRYKLSGNSYVPVDSASGEVQAAHIDPKDLKPSARLMFSCADLPRPRETSKKERFLWQP